MDTIGRIEQAKKQITDVKSELDRVQGRIDQLRIDIKSKFGVNTMKKAKLLLKELNVELAKMTAERTKKTEKVQILCDAIDNWLEEN